MTEQQTQERTQELVKLQLGTLLLINCTLQAEKETLQAAVAAAEQRAVAAAQRSGPPDGAQSADGPEKLRVIHGGT